MPIEQPKLPRFQGLRRVSYALKVLNDLRGKFFRTCNLCGYEGKFLPTGRPPRYDAKCPRCQSVERHRLLVLADQNNSRIPPGSAILHFAPEPALSSYLRHGAMQYITADIVPGRADLTLNIEHLNLDNDSYDVIVASHILEHVDDRRALSELFRVLRPGGHLFVFTPVVESWPDSYENPLITTGAGRTLHFGQYDHVRYYGRDVRDRIASAGFSLEEFHATPEEAVRYGLVRGEVAFIAIKPLDPV